MRLPMWRWKSTRWRKTMSPILPTFGKSSGFSANIVTTASKSSSRLKKLRVIISKKWKKYHGDECLNHQNAETKAWLWYDNKSYHSSRNNEKYLWAWKKENTFHRSYIFLVLKQTTDKWFQSRQPSRMTYQS